MKTKTLHLINFHMQQGVKQKLWLKISLGGSSLTSRLERQGGHDMPKTLLLDNCSHFFTSDFTCVCIFEVYWMLCTACLHEQTPFLSGATMLTADIVLYCNLSKISPASKIRPFPFFKWSCCKGCFSLESMPTHLCLSTCCYAKQEASKKQHKGRHGPLLLLRKQASKRIT